MYPRLLPWVRLGWLLALLRGRIPYPVLVLNGECREFGEIIVRVSARVLAVSPERAPLLES
jgi:hypothetical protein